MDEIRAGIESWLREALVAPFSYRGALVDGRFVAFGQDMVQMAEHGLAERVGQVGQARAEADLSGLEKIQFWLRNIAQDGDVVCLLSPPGTEKEGFGANGQRRLSFTQFGIVTIHDDIREIRMVSIPEKEISITEHIERVRKVWSEIVLKWESEVVKSDRGLVSTPFYIKADQVGDGLNEYVKLQKRKSWNDIETELQNGLALNEDDQAETRRQSLINTITWQVMRYVAEKDSKRLNNIGLIARIVMAREAAGKYLGKKPVEIVKEYTEIEGAKWYQQQLKGLGGLYSLKERFVPGPETIVANEILARLRNQLTAERDVREMLMGSSCGGGGLGDVMGEGMNFGRIGLQGNYLDVLAGRANSLQKSESSSETMNCVECPFCHKIVDAIVTSSSIKCPNPDCNAEVSRS